MSYPLNFSHVTLTHPNPHTWIIELHNGQDNRLTEDLVLRGLRPALDAVEKDWVHTLKLGRSSGDKNAGAGAVIIVGNRSQDKFFSNGLDYANAIKNKDFFPVVFDPLLARLLTFPIPVIAAINGHCFAGGFMLALACDYRVMGDGKKRNAWLCMNEVHFGANWPASFAAILRAKFGSGRLQRVIAAEGHRFTPDEALKEGILDHVVASRVVTLGTAQEDAPSVNTTVDILTKAEEVATAVGVNAKAGAWGLIKAQLYQDTLKVVTGPYVPPPLPKL